MNRRGRAVSGALLAFGVIVLFAVLLFSFSRRVPPGTPSESDTAMAAEWPVVPEGSGSGAAGEPAETASLVGSVFVAGDEAPLRGIAVRVIGRASEVVTDGRGRFELDGLPFGEAVVAADAGYPFGRIARVVRLSSGVNEIALELEPRYELEVLVVDGTTGGAARGAPISGARVHLGAPDLSLATDGARRVEPAAITDARGRCDLAGIGEGRGALRVSAEGYLPADLVLPFRFADRAKLPHLRDRKVRVRLIEGGGVVRGRVLDRDGGAVSGAIVCLDTRGSRGRGFQRHGTDEWTSPQFALTNDAGEFSLAAPAHPASLALLVCANRRGHAPIVRHEVNTAGTDREQIVRVPAARSVSLRVTRRNGTPVAGRIRVTDGVVAYDLASEPLLTRIPGFDEAFLMKREPDGLTLDLPEGGYSALFEPEEIGLERKAFYLRVTDDSPHDVALVLDV